MTGPAPSLALHSHLLPRPLPTLVCQAAAQSPAHGAEVVDITPRAAVAFIGLASCMLLVLFFFLSKAFFYILVG